MAKIFKGKEISFLFSQMKIFFNDVYCAKPKSSRNSSQEAFIIGRGFKYSEGNPLCNGTLVGEGAAKMEHSLLTAKTEEEKKENAILKAYEPVIQYVRCGDISALNAQEITLKKEEAKSDLVLESIPLNSSLKEYMSLFE